MSVWYSCAATPLLVPASPCENVCECFHSFFEYVSHRYVFEKYV